MNWVLQGFKIMIIRCTARMKIQDRTIDGFVRMGLDGSIDRGLHVVCRSIIKKDVLDQVIAS